MAIIVLNGRYWTWEKIALLFCALNLIYIPGRIHGQPVGFGRSSRTA